MRVPMRWWAWAWLATATVAGSFGLAAAYRDPVLLRIDAFSEIYSAASLTDRLMLTIVLVLPLVGAIGAAAFILLRRGTERAAVVFAVGLVGIYFYASGAPLGLPSWIGNTTSSTALVLMVGFLVTFPSGTFRPRWSVAAPALTAVLVVVRVDLAVGIRVAMSRPEQFSDRVIAGLGLGSVFLIAALAQVARYRRLSSATERYQTRWVLAALVLMLTPPVVFFLAGAIGLASSPVVGYVALFTALGSFALPAAVAIAAFRYNLYEIDRIISRTVTYAIVAIVISVVYGTTVVLLPALLGSDGPAFVAGATLAAAMVFEPVRRRVQVAVGRRFNRRRYDTESELVALSTELASATEIPEIRSEVAGVLSRTIEPAAFMWWVPPDADTRAVR